MNTLKVTIDHVTNSVSVFNNGKGIPIILHAKEKVYIPELIFGHLLTSSNYNDEEKKVTGGRNGYGAKLCNIFSTEFVVETADFSSGKKYCQTFTNNMSKKTTPEISTYKSGKDYTKITFKPDLSKFGMSGIDLNLKSMLARRVYDVAGCVRGIQVFLNDKLIPIKNFKQYVEMYTKSAKDSENSDIQASEIIYEKFSDRWEIAVTASPDGQFHQVSFVNGIWTSKGGTHVSHISDQLVDYLMGIIKKKSKSVTIKAHQIKNHLWIFVNCLIENPSFDSQTKEYMTLKTTAFGSKCILSESFLKQCNIKLKTLNLYLIL